MFIVGITQRTVVEEKYNELRDALSHDWAKYLQSLFPDGTFVTIPNTVSNIEKWVEALSINALILSNGENLGENLLRDEIEIRLVQWARYNQVPVLGVCRGLQVINHIYGGSICENITEACQMPHVGHHILEVIAEPFRSKVGETIYNLNSYHNQGVLCAGLAGSLEKFAVCGDCVEGLFDPSDAVMAIQWHPEREHGGGKEVDSLITDFLTKKFQWIDKGEIPVSPVSGE